MTYMDGSDHLENSATSTGPLAVKIANTYKMRNLLYNPTRGWVRFRRKKRTSGMPDWPSISTKMSKFRAEKALQVCVEQAFLPAILQRPVPWTNPTVSANRRCGRTAEVLF